jgi:hypothetical protein
MINGMIYNPCWQGRKMARSKVSQLLVKYSGARRRQSFKPLFQYKEPPEYKPRFGCFYAEPG